MKWTLFAGAALGLVLAWTAPALASPELAATMVSTSCPCDGDGSGAVWKTHAAYVSCVQLTLSNVVRSGMAAAHTRPAEFRCATDSICGRPGTVVCLHGGKCRIVRSAERCAAHGGTVSGAQSCCGAGS